MLTQPLESVMAETCAPRLCTYWIEERVLANSTSLGQITITGTPPSTCTMGTRFSSPAA